jgi:hypothetical protein
MATKGKPPTKDRPAAKDTRLKWTQTPHVEAGLLRIQKLGIYGRDLTEIMNHIVGEELRRLLESGLLTRAELAEAVNEIPKSRLFKTEKEGPVPNPMEPSPED